MDKNNRILIVGFGRSGTTWLADIISKCLGGLILFEPFHPFVFPRAKDFIYSTQIANYDRHYINQLFNRKQTNPWLFRNVLSGPIEETDQSVLSYFQQHTPVIGLKTVRGIHLFQELAMLTRAQVVYIYRDPFAMIASLLNRPNYFKEFGWDQHQLLYWNKVSRSHQISKATLTKAKEIKDEIKTIEEQIALIWSVSLAIGFHQCQRYGHVMVSYEDLYMRPFEITKKILFHLTSKDIQIHPSYLFTPSMTTMKTLHHKTRFNDLNRNYLDQIFWKKRLETESIHKINHVIDAIAKTDERFRMFLETNNYLREKKDL